MSGLIGPIGRQVSLPSLEELIAQAAEIGCDPEDLIERKIQEIDAAMSRLPPGASGISDLRAYLRRLPAWASAL
jgi:hypothetical protein